MKRAGPGGRHAHTDFAGVLGVCARHERGHFLVSHANVVEAVRSAAHRAHQAINAVARKAEDAFHAPLAETFENEITHRSEEHTSELQSLMRISYAVFCLKKKKIHNHETHSQ